MHPLGCGLNQGQGQGLQQNLHCMTFMKYQFPVGKLMRLRHYNSAEIFLVSFRLIFYTFKRLNDGIYT